MQHDEVVATPEAAAELGISTRALYDLVDQGELVLAKVKGRYQVPRSSLDAYRSRR